MKWSKLFCILFGICAASCSLCITSFAVSSSDNLAAEDLSGTTVYVIQQDDYTFTVLDDVDLLQADEIRREQRDQDPRRPEVDLHHPEQ